MRRAATAIGALAMVATLATACGSSGSSADSEDEVTVTTQAEATTTTAAGPTEAELTSMLLTAADMGEGWIVAPSDDDSEPGCLTSLTDDGTIPGPKVETQFTYTAPNAEAFVFEGLAYAGSDSASVFAAVTEALDTCTEVSTTAGGPQSMEPTTFPSYGEDSAAWTATFDANGQSITVLLVAALQDDVIVLAMGGQSPGTMEPSAMEPVVEGAVTKVSQGS
jgi:hypothetical protein